MPSYIWSGEYSICSRRPLSDTRIDSSINVFVLPEVEPQGLQNQVLHNLLSASQVKCLFPL